MTTKKTTETTEAPVRRGMFAKYQAAAAVTKTELQDFELNEGDNIGRVISEPMMVRKHWTFPKNATKKMILCARQIDDVDAYIAAGEKGKKELDAYMATLPECPICKMAEEHPGFYTLETSQAFHMVQDGVVKILDCSKSTVLGQLGKFEDPAQNKIWAKMMPNGKISDLEININKDKFGPLPQNVKYTVGGVPGSEVLSDEQLANYRDNAPDLSKLKRPADITTEEGKAKWAEIIAAAGKPADGELPPKRGS